MLSTLPALKLRLAIPDLDVQYDDLLTNAVTALSSAFDKYTNRTLARTANITCESRRHRTPAASSPSASDLYKPLAQL